MILRGRLHRAALKLSGALLSRHQRMHARLERVSQSSERAPYRLCHAPSTSSDRIVHFNGNFAIGGSTQLIVDLIERTSDVYSHEVVVPHCPSPVPYQPVDLRVIPLDRMEELRRSLQERRPCLVHIHYWSRAENRFDATGVWYSTVLAICDELDLPVVQNINVPTKPMTGNSVRWNVYVSRFVKDRFDEERVPAEVIHPGSDFSHFTHAGPVDTPDAIGMVYRLDDDKLNERSIEPFIRVAKARPSTRCIIVGEGLFSALYRRRVEEEHLQNRFEFAGMVSYAGLPSLYRRMGVFVAPVHNESFGQVSPFAMGMGIPVAGYDVGALSEILGSRELLVSPNDEQALAHIVCMLLEDRAKRRDVGVSNRQRANALFSKDAMVERYRDLYGRLLRGTLRDGPNQSRETDVPHDR